MLPGTESNTPASLAKEAIDCAEKDTQMGRAGLTEVCLEILNQLGMDTVPVGLLPPHSSFEYDGRICRRSSGIYCSDDRGTFGLEPNALVKPRPDIIPATQ